LPHAGILLGEYAQDAIPSPIGARFQLIEQSQ
jgi:hypothetical protein